MSPQQIIGFMGMGAVLGLALAYLAWVRKPPERIDNVLHALDGARAALREVNTRLDAAAGETEYLSWTRTCKQTTCPDAQWCGRAGVCLNVPAVELRRVAAVTGQPLGKLVADLSALAAGVDSPDGSKA